MLILSEAQVRQCLSIEKCIAANRLALGSLCRFKGECNDIAKANVPTRIILPAMGAGMPGDATLFKPAAYYPGGNASKNGDAYEIEGEEAVIMGSKVVSVRADNPSIGKPTVPATITMLNAKTGEVSALMGATYLTAARTAAGSAIATKLCVADNDGKHLVVFGAGMQAELHIRCLANALPGQIQTVTIVNRSRARAENLCDLLRNEKDNTFQNIKCRVIILGDRDDVKDAVGNADIIVTATNTSQALFDGKWVKSNCHINGVGSYLPTSEEIDSDFVRDRCLTIVDTTEALEVGDLKHVDKNSSEFVGLLGDMLEGGVTIGKDDLQDKCTFFKSVGTAIQDIVTANEVVTAANKKGIGTTVDIL